jgi:hypothetical protein
MPDDPEARRDEFELFGDVFADRLQGAATVRAITGRCGIGNGVARQMVRQWLASAFGPCSLDRFCGRCRVFGFIGLKFLELQFELRDLLVELLGFAAKALAAQCGKLDLQGLDDQLTGTHRRFKRPDLRAETHHQRLQGIGQGRG